MTKPRVNLMRPRVMARDGGEIGGRQSVPKYCFHGRNPLVWLG
jgi:hypothetical protein